MKKIEQTQPSTHVNEYRDAGFYRYPDDEISLVDLAKILVHRRWWFVSTFLLSVVIAAGFAWIKSTPPAPVPATPVSKSVDQVAFTSFVALGYKTPNHFIEPIASVETQILGAYYPLLIEQHPEFAKYQVSVNYAQRRNLTQDEGSNLISIITLAAEAQRSEVERFHQLLLDPLLNSHQELLNTLLNQSVQRESRQFDFQALPTRLTAIAVPALAPAPVPTPQGRLTPTLILALGVVLGGMFGIMAAFVAEFVCRVRQSLNEEKV